MSLIYLCIHSSRFAKLLRSGMKKIMHKKCCKTKSIYISTLHIIQFDLGNTFFFGTEHLMPAMEQTHP